MADPQVDPVLVALQQKLDMYEAAGMTDQVKSVKARIAKREKGVPKASTARLTDVASRRRTDVATLSNPVTTQPKPTVKKAAKKSAKK